MGGILGWEGAARWHLAHWWVWLCFGDLLGGQDTNESVVRLTKLMSEHEMRVGLQVGIQFVLRNSRGMFQFVPRNVSYVSPRNVPYCPGKCSICVPGNVPYVSRGMFHMCPEECSDVLIECWGSAGDRQQNDGRCCIEGSWLCRLEPSAWPAQLVYVSYVNQVLVMSVCSSMKEANGSARSSSARAMVRVSSTSYRSSNRCTPTSRSLRRN